MGYVITLQVAIRVMLRINRWLGTTCEFVELSDYVSFILRLLIAFGLAFELPVIILALGHAGVIRSAQLRNKRRHVIVGLMIVSMLLTPPDPLTLVLMAVPMALLYEACIWLIWCRERRAKAHGDEVSGP
jgi:sec-independent protein translocase protein TatC